MPTPLKTSQAGGEDLTAKQERFAGELAHNLANGVTGAQVKAYRAIKEDDGGMAKTEHENASRLANKGKVKARVAEILSQGLSSRDITPELIENGLLLEAQEAQSDSARVAAWKTLAQARALLVNVQRDDAQNMSDEDLIDGLFDGIDTDTRALLLKTLAGNRD